MREELLPLAARIRSFLEGHGLAIQEWDRVRTDWLTIGQSATDGGAALTPAAPTKEFDEGRTYRPLREQ